jgi:hypothetical protein
MITTFKNEITKFDEHCFMVRFYPCDLEQAERFFNSDSASWEYEAQIEGRFYIPVEPFSDLLEYKKNRRELLGDLENAGLKVASITSINIVEITEELNGNIIETLIREY